MRVYSCVQELLLPGEREEAEEREAGGLAGPLVGGAQGQETVTLSDIHTEVVIRQAHYQIYRQIVTRQ